MAGILRSIADLTAGDHVCCIYATDDEHRQVVTSFLRHGLERHEKALYVIDARSVETIAGYLRAENMEVERLIASGQLLFLSKDESYLKDGCFDPDRMIAMLSAEMAATERAGFAALRITVEMTWALRGMPGSDRLIEYEIKLNQFFPAHRALALCQYDRRRFPASILLDILRTHPIAVIGTEFYENFYYVPPEDLLGENRADVELRSWMEGLAKRKQMEWELRSLALFPRENPMPVMRMAYDGTLLFANQASQYLLQAWQARADEPRANAPAAVPDEIRQIALNTLADALPDVVDLTIGERVYSLTIVPLPESGYINLYGFDVTERKRVERAQEQEWVSLEKFSNASRSPITEEILQLKPLHLAAPVVFEELSGMYNDILASAIDEQIYKVHHNVAGRLQHLAERLGLLRAAPRDVVHLHVAVMRKKIAELPRTNAQVYIEAGRLALLELMGDLVSYYRLRISPRAGSRISAQSGEEAS